MKNNDRKLITSAGFVFILVFLFGTLQAFASVKEVKAYREAFPDAKVKCTTCHSVAIPKKGAAELNDYGKAAMAAGPTETFKKMGKAEDFKK